MIYFENIEKSVKQLFIEISELNTTKATSGKKQFISRYFWIFKTNFEQIIVDSTLFILTGEYIKIEKEYTTEINKLMNQLDDISFKISEFAKPKNSSNEDKHQDSTKSEIEQKFMKVLDNNIDTEIGPKLENENIIGFDDVIDGGFNRWYINCRNIFISIEIFLEQINNQRSEITIEKQKKINSEKNFVLVQDESNTLIDFFSNCLQLAKIDHQFELNGNVVNILSNISAFFGNCDVTTEQLLEIKKILIYKTHYLQSKINLKLIKDKKSNRTNLPFSNDMDFGPFKGFKIINDEIDEIEKDESDNHDKFRNICPKKHSSADIYKTIKYHKMHGNISKMEEIAESIKTEIKEKRKQSNKIIDNEASKTILSYIDNCVLSKQLLKKDFIKGVYVLAEDEKTTFELLLSDIYKQYEDKNYFPFKKFAEANEKLIEKYLFPADTEGIDLEDVNKLNERFLLFLEKFRLKLNGCENEKYVYFQSWFEDCCTMYKSECLNEIELFLHSSFLLPMDYKEEKLTLDELSHKKRDYLYSFQLEKSLNKKLQQNQDKIKATFESERSRTDEGIKEESKNQIQILAIFAAIVVFAVGDIQLFQKVKDYRLALTFTIAFAYSLGSFVILIKIIIDSKNNGGNKNKEENQRNVLLSVIWLIITALSFVLIYLYSPHIQNNDEDNNMQININNTNQNKKAGDTYDVLDNQK